MKVPTTPNALGEPTKVGNYASEITFHPNAAIDTFRYGPALTGLKHTTAQNLRGLPLRATDAGILDTETKYDKNASPVALTDLLGGVATRTMTYDGLDRLSTSNAPGLWGNASYEFDPLDNLRRSIVGIRDYTHVYVSLTNRLLALKNPNNSTAIGYSYNDRGDVVQRNNQTFTVDLAGRVTAVPGVASYRSDAFGHRTVITPQNGAPRLTLYSREGKLLFETPLGNPLDRIFADGFEGTIQTATTRYIYLSGSEIARQFNDKRWYSVTDVLGSPTAIFDEFYHLIGQKRYDPCGVPTLNYFDDGLGFAGHYTDGATQLSYMLARYYDSFACRFNSTDPSNSDFNRYAYANNNFYKFIDPDGREAACARTGADCFGQSDGQRAATGALLGVIAEGIETLDREVLTPMGPLGLPEHGVALGAIGLIRAGTSEVKAGLGATKGLATGADKAVFW